MPADAAIRYVELIATVAPNDAERASEILRSLADSGTWLERPFAQPSLEDDAVTRDDAPVRIHVYFRGADAAANAGLAPHALRAAGLDAHCHTQDVADTDWAESWKEHFDVKRYGKHVVVVPSWRAYEPAAGDLVISLDPGMAFGTGQHETTRMCLEALERAVKPGMRVLDLGCGSGILSIAAARLGAAGVLALDIDPDCARITRANAARNDCSALIDARVGSLGAGSTEVDALVSNIGVLVANIVAGTIIDLAPHLAAALVPRGKLIASGIIGEREAAVVDALRAAGLSIERVHEMGEWRCIEAVSP
jgi:ribosomal protein L11 methyltransferase